MTGSNRDADTASRLNWPGAQPASLLSNGSYSVFITADGTGRSMWQDVALTRWRGDRIQDRDGFFVYLRDRETGIPWSSGRRPVAGRPERYEVTWRPGAFTIARVEEQILTRLTVCVD
ncbi:MAG TPA: hypothetical protein VEY91_03160, partial [Candidatus Limnocylindria bacterium]|nr:hypothetical protein [Candidatus Limnocylindria bacterium]